MFNELEISSMGVALFFIGIVILTICLIIFFRWKYNFYKLSDLLNINNSKKPGTLSYLTKFPEIDVFKLSGSFFNYGLAVAVGLSLVAISWTTYEKQLKLEIVDLVNPDEVEIEIPRVPEPPAPPPTPPPPVIDEVPDTEIIDDSPGFLDNSIDVDTKVEAQVVTEKKAVPLPPPPPAPAPALDGDDFFKVVEQMPRFPGCEDKATDEDKKKCSEKALMVYIQKHLSYPALAKDIGVDGMAVIQFVVDTDGSVTHVKIVRDIGAGCGEAAATVIRSMNEMAQKWIPGKQRGRPVKVLYTLPVKFKLDH